MASVTLQGVRKIYRDGSREQVAVHGVDLEVADGEFVVLVGPSGCGKSTTLRMIAGLESISGGQLLIGDRVVNHVPAKERDIAMVFQNYALYPHMTAYDNMAFALALRRMPKPEIETRVREAAAILGIEDLLQRKPRHMSGGQRQRVAVGRAIVRHPQVFLFDEPLSNLDAKLRVQMRREISRLHKQLGATMIYVTHDQVEAMTLGDRIVVLNAGHVQQIDAPMMLYANPRNTFVATFIGSPPMNLVTGTLVRGPVGAEGDGGKGGSELHFRANDGVMRLPLPGRWASALAGRAERAVVLGIRPEELELSDAPGSGDVSMRIDLVEPLGNEMLVYASAGAVEVTARAMPRRMPPQGDPIAVRFAPERLHIFDAETTESLAAPAG
ncbi:MAG: sn-glycerol-3-phosphate ABC transporter ATP-binding protein UgpC [Gemmatimonadota bacterium]|nr:sn-glycerol-3-phosphate ABC transporter ATP-binding protein UgpC [Gemmatimonadota bacterium]